MSYAAKVKYGLASGHSLPPPVPAQDKNERASTHNYKLNQDVMYLDSTSNKKPRGFMQSCFLFLNVGFFFLWRFNFYGFYIALAPRLNIV